jgi:hypothetical protein
MQFARGCAVSAAPLYDAKAASDPQLQSITFVEFSPGNFVRTHHSLENAVAVFGSDSEHR